jgi:ArsR family transcriptional regulator
MKEKIVQMAELFKILSSDVRLCILVNLCLNKEKRVTDLQDCAGVSQSLISQQLAKLRAAKVIDANKKGNEVYYSIANKEIEELVRKTILE